MRNKPIINRLDSKDSGMTLVELMVSISLGLIVLTLLAAMMIGVYGTQERVTNSSKSANEAQLGSEIFRSAIRSSTGVKISSVTVDGLSGQLLVTRTLDSENPGTLTPSATCFAFLWKPQLGSTSQGSIFWSTASSMSGLPPSNTTAGWRDLVVGVSPLPPAVGSTLQPSVFSSQGTNYEMAFSTEPGTGPKTTISVSSVAPTLKKEVSGGCY